MQTRHTPGPWTFYRRTSCDRGDTFGVEAPAPHYCVIPALNINPADAHLIAAAPELLAALKNALNVLAGIAAGDLKTIEKDSPAIQLARAAIAKATGQKL